MNMPLPAPLSQRRADSHKGDYGHVFVLAGSKRYIGAACLCAESALKAGAGLVTLGVPCELYPIIASKAAREVMYLPLAQTSGSALAFRALKEIREFSKKADCLLLGPGLSTDPDTMRLVRSVAAACDVPMVLDADALKAIAEDIGVLKKRGAATVLTPHSGEMAKLCGRDVGGAERARKKVAKDFALRYNIALILKGHRSVVASGDGHLFVNTTGNPGMATAGSGDVLSGILAAFLAQGIPVFDAARLAACLHGLAGDLAAKDKTQVCLMASDIIEYLPRAFKKIRHLS